MAQPPLTRRQRQILDFIKAYEPQYGMSPTYEEIAQHFGLNKVTIFGHVKELERKGFLKRAAPGISRGLQLVEDPSPNPTTSQVASLKILGCIAAGAPIEAIEDPEVFEFQDLVPAGSDVYVLRVQGDSMIEDAICDGDLVLVERREVAHDGETVVAVLPDGECTLKRFYREKGGYRLQPANSNMEPIFVSDLQIRGVVIGVVRRF